MRLPLLTEDELLTSELVRSSFDMRSETITAERVGNLVFWLITNFLYGRCAWLASAAARTVGPDRYVAFHHPDGRLAHAVLACEPQRGRFLFGDCVDVMGRRSLASVHASVGREVGTVSVAVDGIIDPADFEGDEAAHLALASEMPWFRLAMGLEAGSIDGERLLSRATDLGHEPDVAPFP